MDQQHKTTKFKIYVRRNTFFSLDGEVRLRGSNETNEGRVEIKLGGIWGTISEKDWDIRDGHVVCRQLGYRQAVRVYSHSR